MELRLYDNVTHYGERNDTEPLNQYDAGFALMDICNKTLDTPLPANIASGDLPCSLNESQELTNLANPVLVYLTLDTGISQMSSGFNGIDFSSLKQGQKDNTATEFQIVTFLHEGFNHSLFFNPYAAVEYTIGPRQAWGIDYVANTTSMVTHCSYITHDCDIRKVDAGRNNISIPYNCSNDFNGDLGQTPSTGHERAQGWNMSFYERIDGSARTTPVQAQSNPFNFHAAAAVNSIPFEDFMSASDLPEATPENGSFVDAGRGFLTFALDCQATIYDVSFSLINGSFKEFNVTKSSPQKASIVKAPLQVGFGQYRLYQAAALGVLANNQSVATTMGNAFSQTGMALASGVFDFDENVQQRFRWTEDVTQIQKAPFHFLVVVCLVYSVFGMVMTTVAFSLRRAPQVKDQQAHFMFEWASKKSERKSSKEETWTEDTK